MRFASGCQIENQGAHLFRVGNADAGSFHDFIAIEYQTRDSRRRIEVFSIADIAAHSIQMYNGRFGDRAS
jgi:hypothetical protein